MKKLIAMSLGLSFCVASYSLVAADFDGSKPLLCATIEAIECGPGDECLEGTAEGINAPQFFRIHFNEKTLSATKENGEDQSTGIRTMERVDGMLVMQGIEAGRAWSLVISEYTGKMSVSVAGDREGFVLFGVCTPL